MRFYICWSDLTHYSVGAIPIGIYRNNDPHPGKKILLFQPILTFFVHDRKYIGVKR
jgi:hypothetical protein